MLSLILLSYQLLAVLFIHLVSRCSYRLPLAGTVDIIVYKGARSHSWAEQIAVRSSASEISFANKKLNKTTRTLFSLFINQDRAK